ncbi:hypothetical protein PN498_11080 [Oscillatoria sp. CS-180]|uniref:hypothetical protein n=1 Tax=Oscillatoria sp. CS-180 TaxID=3021720 RepID=UPI00232A9E63|nr:hypothetical protein [Oscillatoria sp. CS-180]MDB9526534.1 hypothetical protein [Oscillatoria sp. CS-180]
MRETNINVALQSTLFEKIKDLAKTLNIAWPRLVVIALADYIRRHEARESLLADIDAAHAEDEDESELTVVQHMRSTHRKLIEGEW